MKKILAIASVLVLLICFTSCGSGNNKENNAVPVNNASQNVFENISNNTGDTANSNTGNANTGNTANSNTGNTNATPPVSEQKKTMGVTELDALLSSLPVSIDSTKYVVQDEKYKSLYPDILQVIIHNHTNVDIKNAVIAFVAWDANNLPVKIKESIDFTDGAYVRQVKYNDINLVPDQTYGENSGFQIDENCGISTFKAIIYSFETFDGDSWENPYYDEWCNLYEGVKYSSDLAVEVKIDEKAAVFVESGTKKTSNNIDGAELSAQIEKQDFRVIEAKYTIQDTKYKSLYPDLLQAIISNNTSLDIKSAVIAFVAWDSNGLPVKIKGQFDFSDGAYIRQVSYDDINMIPNSTYGDKVGFELDESNGIALVKAIVVSYEAFDGTKWTNPLYNDWCKLYEGVKIK